MLIGAVLGDWESLELATTESTGFVDLRRFDWTCGGRSRGAAGKKACDPIQTGVDAILGRMFSRFAHSIPSNRAVLLISARHGAGSCRYRGKTAGSQLRRSCALSLMQFALSFAESLPGARYRLVAHVKLVGGFALGTRYRIFCIVGPLSLGEAPYELRYGALV